MDKETLFKEIKQGRALLWVGAGFSRYAGYPMGAAVVQILYNELSNAQKQEIANQEQQKTPECPKWPLPKFAQYFIDLHHGNRTKLIEILDRIFSATPTTIHVHEQLARVSYIDHIVTTNYDPLFELAYRTARLHMVGQASQIPQIGNKEVTLYKIHGQPSIPESVIITEDDYNDFFNNADDIVWTYLRGLMSTRTIVFVGYAVEDPNILAVFDGLVKKLGKLMKMAYAVGPHMERVREERLLRNNIHYIQSTGEDFIADLWKYIQETALADLPKDGIAAVKPVGKILTNLGLEFKLSIEGDRPIINSISKPDGSAKSSIEFSTDSVELAKAIESFHKGKSMKAVRINLSELKSFSHKVEGFKMPFDNDATLLLTKVANWEGIIDVRLDSSIVIPGVAVWTYNGDDVVHIVALTTVSRLDITMPKPQDKGAEFELFIEPRYSCYRNTKEAREHAMLISAFANKQLIEIFHKGQTIWNSVGYESTLADAIAYNSSIGSIILNALELVEKEFGIMFTNFVLNNTDLNDLRKLIHVLEHLTVPEDSPEEFLTSLMNPTIEELTILSNKRKERNLSISMNSSGISDFVILGWTLRISWKQKLHILRPFFRKIPGEKAGIYGVVSKAKLIAVEYYEADDKVVVQAPISEPPKPLTLEETIQERLPNKGE